MIHLAFLSNFPQIHHDHEPNLHWPDNEVKLYKRKDELDVM